jgi:hypothetical protein
MGVKHGFSHDREKNYRQVFAKGVMRKKYEPKREYLAGGCNMFA